VSRGVPSGHHDPIFFGLSLPCPALISSSVARSDRIGGRRRSSGGRCRSSGGWRRREICSGQRAGGLAAARSDGAREGGAGAREDGAGAREGGVGAREGDTRARGDAGSRLEAAGRQQLGAMELGRAAHELGAAAGETILVGGRWRFFGGRRRCSSGCRQAHVGSHRERRERGENRGERAVPLRVGQDGHPMRTRVAVRDDSNSPQIFSRNGSHADSLSI
jgi:hypothetical protein